MRLVYLFENNKINTGIETLLKIDGKIPQIKKMEGSNCSIVEYDMEGDSELIAKIMSKINYKIVNNFKPMSVLINESSEYFNKRLYPLVNEFERKLRELLYLVKALYDDKKAKKEIYNLEKKTFGNLYTLLFVDNKFNSALNNYFNSRKDRISKKALIDYVNEIEEKTLFDKLFKEELPEFKKNFKKVSNYRNEVMHARNISFEDYITSKKMFELINSQIDSKIESITSQQLEKTNAKYSDFNNSLEKILDTDRNIRAYEKLINSSISTQRDFEEILNQYPNLIRVKEELSRLIHNTDIIKVQE